MNKVHFKGSDFGAMPSAVAKTMCHRVWESTSIKLGLTTVPKAGKSGKSCALGMTFLHIILICSLKDK
jgi:hypothetical protein